MPNKILIDTWPNSDDNEGPCGAALILYQL